MTRMTGPDCVVMCNLINTHTHTHTRTHFYSTWIFFVLTRGEEFLYLYMSTEQGTRSSRALALRLYGCAAAVEDLVGRSEGARC